MSSSSWRNHHRYSPDDIVYVMNENGEKKSLGKGGQGFVYLAHMLLGPGKEKTLVAVKQLKEGSREFEREIETISRIHHDHLVSLLGYCEESGQKILLYEYMGNGSLAAYVKMECPVSLSWPQWVNICLGVARGLQHLHTKTGENPRGIIHRDVKPGNILLNDNWVAKLSDFGTLKLSSVDSDETSRFVYSAGYLAPEYQVFRQAATHSDVFSFGVVLFQVLCRKMPCERPPEDDSYFYEDGESSALWAEQNVNAKLKAEIPDDSLKAFSAIIGKCLQVTPKRRPAMDDVVKDLEKVLLGLQNVGLATGVFNPTKSNIHALDEELEYDYLETIIYKSDSSLEREDIAAAQEYSTTGPKTDLCSLSWRGSYLHDLSLKEIKGGTNNFDKRNIIGLGGLGTVYLANLDLGSGKGKTPVAVKVFANNFMTDSVSLEFSRISRLEHPHIVSPIGYCNDHGQEMLIYEYMQNGSLSNLVRSGGGSTTRVSFGWQGWLKICLGAARGLQRLHTESDEFPKGIIHRNVKSGNILLDEDWVAKVSGFELMELSSTQSDSARVPNHAGAAAAGYMAPEYVMYRKLTRETNVFAFGVVMFQVLCRKMPRDRGGETYTVVGEEDLGVWAKENAHGDIKEDSSDASLRIFSQITGEALHFDPRERPTMDQVVSRLEISLMLQQHEERCRATHSRSLSAAEVERLLSSQLGCDNPYSHIE